MKNKFTIIFIIILCLVVLLGFKSYKVLIYSNTLGTEVSNTLYETYQLYHDVLVSYREGTIDNLEDTEIVRMTSIFERSTVLHNPFDIYRMQLINGTIIELIESEDLDEQKELYQFAIELEVETNSLISYAFELSGGEKGIDSDGNEKVLHPRDISLFASLCNENSTNYKKFEAMLDDTFDRQYKNLKLIVDKYSD